MSSIWTPSGEHPTGDANSGTGSGPGPGAGRSGTDADLYGLDEGEELTPEQVAQVEAEMFRARAELASVPVADIVANHAVGLWQLAVLHLTPDALPDGSETAPRLDEAALAIDAFAGLVEGLGPRLGPHHEALQDALAQLRLAYVAVLERTEE